MWVNIKLEYSREALSSCLGTHILHSYIVPTNRQSLVGVEKQQLDSSFQVALCELLQIMIFLSSQELLTLGWEPKSLSIVRIKGPLNPLPHDAPQGG